MWTLEEGIRQITQVPVALLGLVDRGVLRPGAPADLFVFDPDTIGPWKKEFVHDLPGGVGRFKAWGRGVHATIVNGEPIVLAGELTGRLPGRVISPRRGPMTRTDPHVSSHEADAGTRPWAFDADGHVVEPASIWETHLAPEFRSYARRACSSSTTTSGSCATTGSGSGSARVSSRWARRARPPT